jgi:hypothetical protein
LVDLLLTRTQHSAQSHSSDRVRSHQALAILEAINHLGRVVADAILRDGHLLAEKLFEARCRRAQRELVLGAVLGTAKVGRDGNTGTVVKKVPRVSRLTFCAVDRARVRLQAGFGPYLIVGIDARMRVSSVMVLPSSGTLRSQRISTCSQHRQQRH